jgi:hypothetical protein
MSCQSRPGETGRNPARAGNLLRSFNGVSKGLERGLDPPSKATIIYSNCSIAFK